MAGYAIRQLEEVPDISGDYPGEIRMCSRQVDAEQVAFTFRRMPPGTGGKGSYGHRHKTQEELYYVISGKAEFKLEGEVIEAGPGTLVRCSPEVARSVWNEGPEDVELLIVSTRIDDLMADVEKVSDFWPA